MLFNIYFYDCHGINCSSVFHLCHVQHFHINSLMTFECLQNAVSPFFFGLPWTLQTHLLFVITSSASYSLTTCEYLHLFLVSKCSFMFFLDYHGLYWLIIFVCLHHVQYFHKHLLTACECLQLIHFTRYSFIFLFRIAISSIASSLFSCLHEMQHFHKHLLTTCECLQLIILQFYAFSVCSVG